MSTMDMGVHVSTLHVQHRATGGSMFFVDRVAMVACYCKLGIMVLLTIFHSQMTRAQPRISRYQFAHVLKQPGQASKIIQ